MLLALHRRVAQWRKPCLHTNIFMLWVFFLELGSFLALFVRFPPSLKTQQFQISVRSELERREDITEPIVRSSFEYFMVPTDWLYLQIPSATCHLNRPISTAKPHHLYIVTWWCRLKYSDQCLLPFLNGWKYWAVALEKCRIFYKKASV